MKTGWVWFFLLPFDMGRQHQLNAWSIMRSSFLKVCLKYTSDFSKSMQLILPSNSSFNNHYIYVTKLAQGNWCLVVVTFWALTFNLLKFWRCKKWLYYGKHFPTHNISKKYINKINLKHYLYIDIKTWGWLLVLHYIKIPTVLCCFKQYDDSLLSFIKWSVL